MSAPKQFAKFICENGFCLTDGVDPDEMSHLEKYA